MTLRFDRHPDVNQQHVRRNRVQMRAAGMFLLTLGFVVVGLGSSFWNNSMHLDSNLQRQSYRSSDGGRIRPYLQESSNDTIPCGNFSHVGDECYFVQHNPDCVPDDGFINYLELPFCVLHSVPGGIVLMLVWLLFLFIALGVTAEEFFCPALSVISDTLKLSHNVAGVTFLALGNGAPDMFSVYSSIVNQKDGALLAIGSLFGAGMFVTTTVVGVICFLNRFAFTRRPVLRDIIVYLIATSWTYYILWDQHITTFEAAGFIVIYVLYVIVVVVGRAIYQKSKKSKGIDRKHKRELEERNRAQSIKPGHHSIKEALDITESLGVAIAANQLENRTHHTAVTQHRPQFDEDEEREDSFSDDDDDNDSMNISYEDENDTIVDERTALLLNEDVESNNSSKRLQLGNAKTWRDLAVGLQPFKREDWEDSGVFGKVYLILQSPINFALKITIPVVDPDEVEDGGWRQYLQMLQCLCAPIFFVFGANLAFMKLGGVYPVWLLAMMVGGLLAILVWACTRASVRPSWHAAFAFMGFVVAVVWIYMLANEIVNLLQTLGRLIGVSDAFLGLTVLAWGNSIGDFVSNLTIAKQGFPLMAVGACFGGPALNMLLGIGVSCTVATIERGGKYIVSKEVSPVLAVSGGFLLLSLLSSLVMIPACKFKANKWHGVYLCTIYVAYLATAVTLEFTT